MPKRDYYDILGLSRGASEQDIKAAFRRLAKDCHPDRNAGDKGAETKFKELNEAYEALRRYTDELWRTMTAIWPAYDEYQGKTDRDIPVVVLERQG